MMTARKITSLAVAAALLGVAAAQFWGCEKYVLPELDLSQDTLRFKAAADSQMIHVTTNVVTTAQPPLADQRWVSTDPVWFDETSNVKVKVTENTGATRTTTIPVKSETILKNLIVIQEGKE